MNRDYDATNTRDEPSMSLNAPEQWPNEPGNADGDGENMLDPGDPQPTREQQPQCIEEEDDDDDEDDDVDSSSSRETGDRALDYERAMASGRCRPNPPTPPPLPPFNYADPGIPWTPAVPNHPSAPFTPPRIDSPTAGPYQLVQGHLVPVHFMQALYHGPPFFDFDPEPASPSAGTPPPPYIPRHRWPGSPPAPPVPLAPPAPPASPVCRSPNPRQSSQTWRRPLDADALYEIVLLTFCERFYGSASRATAHRYMRLADNDYGEACRLFDRDEIWRQEREAEWFRWWREFGFG